MMKNKPIKNKRQLFFEIIKLFKLIKKIRKQGGKDE